MRIGTNHGSLSARILSYYGDTPRGMVESAFEFANICRDVDYHNFLFSMKASNPLVMVQAYRLLAEEMYSNGWDYPLHLGVTEVSIHVLTEAGLQLFLPEFFLFNLHGVASMRPLLLSFVTIAFVLQLCVTSRGASSALFVHERAVCVSTDN